MKQLPISVNKIIGKWQIVKWEKQHAFYQPDQDALNNIGDWEPFEPLKLKESPSNFICTGISQKHIDKINSKEVQFEFTDNKQRNGYNFNILVNNKIINEVHWEISLDPDYCDISILMGEVYNYARCKAASLTQNELILVERIDNTESDTYFHKISLERIFNNDGISNRIKSWFRST